MPEIYVTKPFKHSDDGINVNTYDVGLQAVSDRCAEVAINQLNTATLKPELETKPARKPRQTKG